jgi:hypothetical protein
MHEFAMLLKSFLATDNQQKLRCLLLAYCILLAPLGVQSQDQTMPFEEYEPRSTLVVPAHPITRAKYPFIDVHNHQSNMSPEKLKELAADMDKLNMAVMVNLSGRGFRRIQNPDGTTHGGLNDSEYLKKAVENANATAPGRFIIFTNVDFNGIGNPGWTEKAAKELETDVKNGAGGLKVYKSLGLEIKDTGGKRVSVDDPRLDPIWAKCGELKIPVLIHSGDPAPFWLPQDKFNERWLELKQFPDRYRYGKEPSWEQVMNEQFNVFKSIRNRPSSSAHMAWMGNDLARLGKLLDEISNMYTRLARSFMSRAASRASPISGSSNIRIASYSEKIFGLRQISRLLPRVGNGGRVFRLLSQTPRLWKMYGLELPDEVLKTLLQNALRILRVLQVEVSDRVAYCL